MRRPHELEEEARTKPVSSVEIAAVHAALGQRERCFHWLARAFQQREALLHFLAVDPRFDRYRDDPRFQDLLRRIGFPATPVAAGSER